MPIVDANDPHTWAYQWTGGYRREKHQNRERQARILIDALDLSDSSRVLIIGGAFGFGAEWLEQLCSCGCVVADTSEWIHANKGEHASHEILNLDILESADREQLIERGPYQWVLSENVLPWLTVEEAQELDRCMRLCGRAAHFVTMRIDNAPPEPEPKWSWYSIEEWKKFLPDATIIASGSGETL